MSEMGLGGAVAECARCCVGEGVDMDFCIRESLVCGMTTGGATGGEWNDLATGMGLETLMGRCW